VPSKKIIYISLRILVFLKNIEYISNANHDFKTVFHADGETDVGRKLLFNYTSDIGYSYYNLFLIEFLKKKTLFLMSYWDT